MPITDERGHSNITPFKQASLYAILSQHMAIVERVLANPNNKWASSKYIYIDLFAGCGDNPEEQCDGSPVVFLKSIRDYLVLPYAAYFIEKNEGNAEKLRAVLKAMGVGSGCQCFTGDNATLLPILLRGIPPTSYGIVYADPTKPSDLKTNLLTGVSQSHRRLDFLIRCAATSVKRAGGNLTSIIQAAGKSHWIIQESQGKHQWTFLLGTNYPDYKAWKRFGFYRMDSPEGQQIFLRLNHTAAELETMVQPTLLGPSVRSRVITRSNGICER